MRTNAKIGLTALVAACVLAGAIGTASARNLSTSEQSFRVTFSSLEFGSEIVTIRCRVTLEGSLHTRTIAKVTDALVGAITRAIASHPCTNGEAWADNGTEAQPLGTALNTLPYHLQYDSFAGTLPGINTVNIALTRGSFVIQSTFLGLSCRGRYGNGIGGTSPAAAAREASGGITSVRARGTVNLIQQLGNARVCPVSGTFGGTGTVVNLSTGSRITVTLI